MQNLRSRAVLLGILGLVIVLGLICSLSAAALAYVREALAPRTEQQALAELKRLADQNRIAKSYIGLGYQSAVLPPDALVEIEKQGGSVVITWPDGAQAFSSNTDRLVPTSQRSGLLSPIFRAALHGFPEPEVSMSPSKITSWIFTPLAFRKRTM